MVSGAGPHCSCFSGRVLSAQETGFISAFINEDHEPSSKLHSLKILLYFQTILSLWTWHYFRRLKTHGYMGQNGLNYPSLWPFSAKRGNFMSESQRSVLIFLDIHSICDFSCPGQGHSRKTSHLQMCNPIKWQARYSAASVRDIAFRGQVAFAAAQGAFLPDLLMRSSYMLDAGALTVVVSAFKTVHSVNGGPANIQLF